MRCLGSGLAVAGLLALTACSTPQTALHPVSNPQLTQLRGKIDNLLDKDYEQVYGFSQPGFSVRGGVMVNF